MSFGNVKTRKSTDVGDGDLVLFPLNGKIVLGLLNGATGNLNEVWWDDFIMKVDNEDCLIITKSMIKFSAGHFIGMTFDSFDQAVRALKEHKQ